MKIGSFFESKYPIFKILVYNKQIVLVLIFHLLVLLFFIVLFS